MKFTYIVFALLIICSFRGIGQKADSSNAIIYYKNLVFSKTDKGKKATMQLEITLLPPTYTTLINNVFLELKSNDSTVKIKQASIAFLKSELVSNKTGLKKTVDIEIQTDSSFKLSENKIFFITIDTVNKSAPSKFYNKKEIILQVGINIGSSYGDPVVFSVGSNFDLQNKVVTGSFYGKLRAYIPDIYKCKKGRTIGFYGAIYKNNYISQLKTNDDPAEYYQPIRVFGDSTTFKRVSAKEKYITKYNNYGLTLNIPFTFHVSDDRCTQIAWNFIDLEGVFRQTVRNYSYQTTDSSMINQKSTFIIDQNKNRIKSETVSELTYAQYISPVSFQLNFENKNYKVYFRTVPIGVYAISNSKVWDAFYGIYFTATEKNFGIRIGGELKGLFAFPRPHEKTAPLFNLFITKAFNIADLGKIFGAN